MNLNSVVFYIICDIHCFIFTIWFNFYQIPNKVITVQNIFIFLNNLANQKKTNDYFEDHIVSFNNNNY